MQDLSFSGFCFRTRSLCPKILDLLREHLCFHVRINPAGILSDGVIRDPDGHGWTCVLFPGGLSGIGLGLGPGGQPIDASQINRGGGGGGMGNMGPGGTFTAVFKHFNEILCRCLISTMFTCRNGRNGLRQHGRANGRRWWWYVQNIVFIVLFTPDSGSSQRSTTSVVGMDNFGGMNNNMDRFGSSGVGRMNGKLTWDA